MDCVFCNIVTGAIPKEFEYQDDKILVFADIHPVALVHLVIIPREHVDDFYNVKDDSIYLAVAGAIRKMIEQNKLMGRGYRVVLNGGGAQIIQHLHFHLIGPIGSTARLA